MDTIFIEKLVVMSMIGIYEWENYLLQKLVFDLELRFDRNLNYFENKQMNYINYLDVVKLVFSVVENKRFFLLEEVAEKVVLGLMKKFASVLWIKLKISKPGAILQAVNVGIIVERTRTILV